MARLLLGNIEEGTSDEELKEFLMKYGFPEYDKVQHEAGTGSRPGAIVTFENVSPEVLHKLKERIHDLYWKKGRIVAQVLSDDRA